MRSNLVPVNMEKYGKGLPMARRIQAAKFDTRSARLRLTARAEPYWTKIGRGLALGYRRTRTAVGTWTARRYDPTAEKPFTYRPLGPADDIDEANGETILSFFQAQDQARAWATARPERSAPIPGMITVGEACDSYCDYLDVERKSGADTRRRLKRTVKTALRARRVAELTKTEVEKWRNGLVRRNPDDPEDERRSKDNANREFGMLKAALNRAFADEANGLVSDAAWRRVKAFRGVGRAREEHLDVQQSRRLINSCEGALRNFVTAALLTGMRPPSELALLRCKHFRADLRILSLPDGKTGPRDITLTTEAVRFVETIAAGLHPDDLLLPKDDGKAWGKYDHTEPMREAVKRAKLPAGVTAYTLRHTYASQNLLNGMNMQLLAENMGTSVLMIERSYGKFIAASRRKLIQETGFKLGLKPSKVVPIGRRKDDPVEA